MWVMYLILFSFLRVNTITDWLTDWLHGVVSLRIRQSLSYSKMSQHFMEPEGSLPCSQEPSTAPYPEPDQSSPSYFSKSHFNIILPRTSMSS
jgi:hypothetical protein